MKKNKAGKRLRKLYMKEVVILYKVVREGSSEEMTFEQRPKMEVSLKVHEELYSSQKCTCKVPEAGLS